ncbi:MAG TPA: ABC transporter substrate-binding protein, partial [Thermodesulfobacteriota bacterium]|nr:ABC transporter substrate-binding protein [Thermodesulfobacteriota bacterium]
PNFPNPYSIMGIGTATIFVEGLRRAGQDLTREKFINALETMKDFDTKVLSSKNSFSSNDHLTIRRGIIVKYTGEKQEVVYRP